MCTRGGVRYEVCKWVLLLWLGWLCLWFVTPGPRSWRGQDEKLRDREQQRHLSQPGRRNVGKWGSIFGHFELLSEVRVLILCSLCMMSVMAWWWGPGWCYDDSVLPLSHLVVTNKSNKNPQLIRSDSVQNRFFFSSGRSCWGWFIAMSQTVRVEIDWKKWENYFKNYLQLIEDDTRS